MLSATAGLSLCFYDSISAKSSPALLRYVLFYFAVAWLWWSWRDAVPQLGSARWVAVLAGQVALALVLYLRSPRLLEQLCLENGPFEAGSVLCYGLLAVSCWSRARVVALLGTFLLLEEVDYLGVFGMFLGRTEGVYTGAPHDLIALARLRPFLALIWGLAILLLIASVVTLFRKRLLGSVPRLPPLNSALIVWAALGLGLLLLGSLLELWDTWGAAGTQFPEEFVEFLGAQCLFASVERPLARGR